MSVLALIGYAVGGIVFLILLSGIRFIPNNRIGIIEKRFAGKGSVKSGLIALNGEAGYQPRILRGGLHYLMPIQYVVHTMPLVTISQGKVGYVFARDGKQLDPAQVLASNATVTDFQDVESFLKNGGQRGPQRRILREGTYAFNLVQFIVITEERIYTLALSKEEGDTIRGMAEVIAQRGGFRPVVIKDTDDSIGVVTVHDGPSLAQGEIIAPVVGDDPDQTETYHNKFQDADNFLRAGGQRGRQLQVLVEGTYYVNRLFGTVEMIPKTVIEVGNVGVVVSYTGETGDDLSGKEYRHGELVNKGYRGVWSEPLLPGKYAFNTYAGKVISVPTTNIILKWIRTETGAHRYDENLTEVSLITKDAFEPSLPLSVVVHIDYQKAPLVIQRFGDIKKLVEQTLDPMVSAYFKNVGQMRTLIQLLQDRSAIQQQASSEMREKFAHYNLALEEVLIGTPSSPENDTQIETILMQLRSRQVAEEQVETYNQQEKAAVKERELREAQSRAQMQTKLTEAELNINIQTDQGKAEYQRSLQQAQQIRALAEAEAEKIARIGIAQALATEEQVRAYGGPQFQVTQQVLTRFAEAIQTSGVDVVPRVVVSGGNNAEGGSSASSNVMEGLLTMLLSERFGVMADESAKAPRSPEADALREQIRKDMEKKK
ncbi:SPFH domain-containing protein [Candidatus Villigracilis affinis]|uniref:SPFH domain-containing protein n=1 Tax=Candidatus Villigracilis affinis TaxID=3140682 RepID=UPI002A20A5FE|nr:flotillin family protein [Anaerolineales bacterium]